MNAINDTTHDDVNPPHAVTIEPGMGYLSINSCGDIMRSFFDADGSYVRHEDHSGSIRVDDLASRLGRVPGPRDFEAEHDRLARTFLRPEEIPAYEHYMRMIRIFGEGTAQFTAADGTTWSFFVFHNDLSGCWLLYEPCHPVADTVLWAGIDTLVNELGAWMFHMDEGVGLVSGGDVVDRHVALNFRLDGLTDQQARALAQRVTERLAKVHARAGAALLVQAPPAPEHGPRYRIRRTYGVVQRDAVDFTLDPNELIDPDALAAVYDRFYGEAVQNEGLAEAGRPHDIPPGGARLAFSDDHVSDDTGIDDTYEIEEIG